MADREQPKRREDGVQSRAVTYCLIPADLAGKLHEHLREHFRDQPEVEVVVEMRGRQRRLRAERREAAGEPPAGGERRRIHNVAGRRVGERRATELPIEALELPRRARRHAARIVFAERLEPATRELEDDDTARLVIRFQGGGEREQLFTTLYTRYFDRVYGYMRVALRDASEAEELTQQVFVEVFEALDRYERRSSPFRAWLFTIVRNTAIKHLRTQVRESPADREQLDRAREQAGDDPSPAPILEWITDTDLLLFVERLPAGQRQVLAMRFMLGLGANEIAAILGRSPEAVRAQQSRALRYLRGRLAAIGRGPKGGRPLPTLVPIRQSRVLRTRRYGLLTPGPTG